MKNLRIVLIPALLFLLCNTGTAQMKMELSVLYVGGSPDMEPFSAGEADPEEVEASVKQRMSSFETFLRARFETVEVISAGNYHYTLSYDYDVTIMDGMPKPITPRFHDSEKGINLVEGYFPDDFDRPVLTVGFAGTIGRRNGVKHDMFCLCLLSDAFGFDPAHPVFNEPYKTSLTVADKPTPEFVYSYPHLFPGGEIPETLPMWRVQTYTPDSGNKRAIGLVCRPGGYTDSPDTEFISGGESQKGPNSVAIGRHANYFHWGFAASPNDMTEEAKNVFANSIVYISGYAGQTPIARKYNEHIKTRDEIIEKKFSLTPQGYDHYVRSVEMNNSALERLKKEIKEKKDMGEQTNAYEEHMLQTKPSRVASLEEYTKQRAGELFKIYGTDLAAYVKHFEDNYGFYTYAGGHSLVIDEDAKSLGIPNNDPRILDMSISLLEKGDDPERANRILSRYTLQDFDSPGEWRHWYETYKDSLFFTESGGWVFLANSREPGINQYGMNQINGEISTIKGGKTSDDDPVLISAVVKDTGKGTKIIELKAEIHPGYHIYDHVSRSDIFMPLKVEFLLPEGYDPVGEIKQEPGVFYSQGGTTVYKDSAVFSQEITGNGNGEVRCSLTYQCCDQDICFPPQQKEVTVFIGQ